MENHPIPQDVTGFKFKLIGSVTVKQFLYILGGGILAFAFFILPFPGFIKIPLAFLSGGFGVAMAFIPIEGRPMDIMIKNFAKALPAENQYLYHKKGAEVLINELFAPKAEPVRMTVAPSDKTNTLASKRALLYKTLKMSSSYKPDAREQAVLSTISSYFDDSTAPAPQQNELIDSLSSQTQIARPTMPPAETAIVRPAPQAIVVEAPTPIATAPQPNPKPQQQAPEPVVEAPIVQQAAPIAPEPQAPRVEQASPVNTEEQAIPITPQKPQAAPAEASPTATPSPTPAEQIDAGFPQIPDTPNVAMGIVKDPRGKVLQNILVEILDAHQNPVRAFKTNALGQFAAATPLPNGEYTVLLEDAKGVHEFQKIPISLEGKIFQPLVIVSTDPREKLRQELFGATPTQAA